MISPSPANIVGPKSRAVIFYPPVRFSRARSVERTSLVSIDLVVTNARNEVLLGWRNNKPAQHCWFVSGGVVRKGETLQQAFERVVLDELGVKVELARTDFFIGVYDHHYPDNFADTEGVGTHYVVLAHRLIAD